jgi:hypothetical protein
MEGGVGRGRPWNRERIGIEEGSIGDKHQILISKKGRAG